MQRRTSVRLAKLLRVIARAQANDLLGKPIPFSGKSETARILQIMPFLTQNEEECGGCRSPRRNRRELDLMPQS